MLPSWTPQVWHPRLTLPQPGNTAGTTRPRAYHQQLPSYTAAKCADPAAHPCLTSPSVLSPPPPPPRLPHPAGSWMSRWHQQFTALGISHLRSTTAGDAPMPASAPYMCFVHRACRHQSQTMSLVQHAVRTLAGCNPQSLKIKLVCAQKVTKQTLKAIAAACTLLLFAHCCCLHTAAVCTLLLLSAQRCCLHIAAALTLLLVTPLQCTRTPLTALRWPPTQPLPAGLLS